MTHERRIQPRIDLRVAVHVERESRLQQFYSRNLSKGGIYLEVEGTPPPVGSKLKLSFEVPGLPKGIKVDGEVVHHHMFEAMDDQMHKFKKTGIGLRFTNLDSEDQRLISTYITGRDIHVSS